MEKLKSYGLAIALCGALTQASHAQVLSFTLGINKSHLFTGPYNNRFLGGSLNVNLDDGDAAFRDDCSFNGALVYFGPNPLFCPLGATALIVAGDLDGDGLQDNSTYWAVTQPYPATSVEAFRADAVSLISRPSRELPLLDNFQNSSLILYWNLQNGASLRQYNLTGYSTSRSYAGGDPNSPNGKGALAQMNKELISGQYAFAFPRLKVTETQPDTSVNLGVSVAPMVEAVDVSSRNQSGFRFTTGTWDSNFYQMDPRLLTKIAWTGNSANLVRQATDKLNFLIYYSDGARPDYPSVFTPSGLALTTPTAGSYSLPGGFFAVGDERVMNLHLQRSSATTPVTFDVSSRNFAANLKFVDSYAGFQTLTSNFPAGTAKAKTTATADFDGDGVNNITEFAAEYPTLEQVSYETAQQGIFLDQGEDPYFVRIKVNRINYSGATAGVHPVRNSSVATQIPVNAFIDTEGHAVFEVQKRPLSGTALAYKFQYRAPGTTAYKNVAAGKDWTVTTREDAAVPTSVTGDLTRLNLDPESGGEFATATNQTWTVDLTKTWIVLRSVNPVAATSGAPEFKVTVSAAVLK